MQVYRDPLSTRLFDDVDSYRHHLRESAWQLSNDHDWSYIHRRLVEFKRARAEVLACQSIPAIMQWFKDNADRTMFSPLLGTNPGRDSSAYTEFRPLGGKYVQEHTWVAQNFPYPLHYPAITASGWMIRVMIGMPEVQNPRFNLTAQNRGLTTLGLHVLDAEMMHRNNNMIYYALKLGLMAREFEHIALMLKLKGDIKGRIVYEYL